MADKKISEEEAKRRVNESLDRGAALAGVSRNDVLDFFRLPHIISGILTYFEDYEKCDIEWIPTDDDDDALGKEVCGAEVALKSYRKVVADIGEAERVAAILPDQKLSKKISVVLSSVFNQLGQADVPAEFALAENEELGKRSEPAEAIGCIRDAFKKACFTMGPSLAPLEGEVSVFLDRYFNSDDTVARSEDRRTDKPAENTSSEQTLKEHRSTEIKKRFTLLPGQICFDGDDLQLSTGLTSEVFEKLYLNWGKVVLYCDLDVNSEPAEASIQLRLAKMAITKALRRNKIPCTIENKQRTGYLIKEETRQK